MSYNFSELKKEVEKTQEWLKQEYSAIRTGRATPAILDSVLVDSYGSKMPINQLATITTEDAKTIRITPWDVSQVKEIEKAITDSNLGLSVNTDEKGLRATFPDLTSERRDQLIKLAKQKLEEARISLRSARDDVWDDIQEKEKDGDITEDEKFRLKDEMQKNIDEANKELDGAYAKKETEINS